MIAKKIIELIAANPNEVEHNRITVVEMESKELLLEATVYPSFSRKTMQYAWDISEIKLLDEEGDKVPLSPTDLLIIRSSLQAALKVTHGTDAEDRREDKINYLESLLRND
jgi:hypothetical protein